MLVPGAIPEHEYFELASAELAEVRRRGRLIAHTYAECASVLTRTGWRTPAEAIGYLGQFLREPPAGIAPERYPAAIEELADLGIAGGALYDGLIAFAAREAGGELISLDARAASRYERCGVSFRLISKR